jgi:hypothetical protein
MKNLQQRIQTKDSNSSDNPDVERWEPKQIEYDGNIDPSFLRIIRKISGMRLLELSRQIGMNPSRYSYIESGKIPLSVRIIKQISNKIGVSVEALIFSFMHPPAEFTDYEKDIFITLRAIIRSKIA